MVAAALAAATLTGCSTDTGGPTSVEASPSASDSPAAPVPAGAGPLLARYDLEGMDAVQIIDHLDRLGVDERPTDLTASVRPGGLMVSSGGQEVHPRHPR